MRVSLTALFAAVAIGVSCGGRASPVVNPGPMAASVDLSGSYTLTLIASPSCTTFVDDFSHQAAAFPDRARTRTFEAHVTQTASSASLEVQSTFGEARYAIALPAGIHGEDFSFWQRCLACSCEENFETRSATSLT